MPQHGRCNTRDLSAALQRMQRAQRSRRQRRLAAARRTMQNYPAYKVRWNLWHNVIHLLQHCDNIAGQFFTKFEVCGVYGTSRFPGSNEFQLVSDMGQPAPYAICNAHMSEYCSTTTHWLVCKTCQKNQAQRIPVSVYMTPEYLNLLVAADPIKIQTLSLLDSSVSISEKMHNAFYSGSLCRASPLSNPLISWTEDTEVLDNLHSHTPTVLQTLLAQNILYNPFFQKYLTVLERNTTTLPVPVISHNAVKNIVLHHQQRGPLSHMQQNFLADVIATVIDTSMEHTTIPPEEGEVYRVGTLVSRHEHQLNYINTFIHGACADRFDISLEAALFPYLFPHAKGFRKVTWRLDKYLQHRMLCMFSPFTLVKPYLPIMYQIHQAQLYLATAKNMVFDKHIMKFKN